MSLPGDTDGIQKEHVFKLQFKSHVYFFRADSKYTFGRYLQRRLGPQSRLGTFLVWRGAERCCWGLTGPTPALSSLLGVVLGKVLGNKPTNLVARARPASQTSNWWGGSDLCASSQVDGGDTESQRLSWEGQDPRGRGLRPTLPRWRSRANKQGRQAPHDCPSPQETGGGGRASWRHPAASAPLGRKPVPGPGRAPGEHARWGQASSVRARLALPCLTHLPSSCQAGPPDRLGDGGVQAQKHLW